MRGREVNFPISHFLKSLAHSAVQVRQGSGTVTLSGEIGIGYSHNISQISQYQPNITISAKISQYRPNIPILTKFHNFSQISQFQPNLTISAKYHNFDEISQFQPIFLYFCELLQFLKLPITRASVLTVLQPMCPSYPNSPNYQLPQVLLLISCFMNYSNSLKYRLLGPLI